MNAAFQLTPTGSAVALPTFDLLHRESGSCPTIGRIDGTAWAVFLALYRFMSLDAWCFPSQRRLAMMAHVADVSTVRRAMERLEALGVVEVEAEMMADRTTRNRYRLGPVALAELGDIAERAGQGRRPKYLARGPSLQPPPPELTATTPPSCEPPRDPGLQPADLKEQKQINSLKGETAGTPPPDDVDEVARRALEHLAERWRERPSGPTAVMGQAHRDLVAERLRGLSGSVDERLAIIAKAVDGAMQASRERPPTVRFIFGQLAHFEAHVQRGRGAAPKPARPALPTPARPSVRKAPAPPVDRKAEDLESFEFHLVTAETSRRDDLGNALARSVLARMRNRIDCPRLTARHDAVLGEGDRDGHGALQVGRK